MRTKVSSITLLTAMVSVLLCNIPSVQASYNPQEAVNYSNQWWDTRNPEYIDYEPNDCANFVSQCLIEGGLDLSGYGADPCGCLTTCTKLHEYLIDYPDIKCKETSKDEPIPEWFKAGDPAIFGWREDHPRTHAVFAVTRDGSYVTCNAHSPNDSNTIQEFYEKYPSFDRCTFYHIPREFSGAGSGTEQDPYIITNVNQLQEMNNDLTAWYELGNDIDASATENWNDGAGFIPIGDWPDNDFTGHFDGKGHTINNLYINRPHTGVGLFGYTDSGAEVSNVGLIGVNVNGGDYVAGLVGFNINGIITNSYCTGSVNGGQTIGGLVSYNLYGTIANSYFAGDVTAISAYVGGLAGMNFEGTISKCYSTGSVNGGHIGIGGLVGVNWEHNGLESTITNSYSTASANGYDYVGGLVGNNHGNIDNCYSTGSASGANPRYVGGLVGRNWDTCHYSFWDTESSGQNASSCGTGKTTSELKQQATFFGWDFNNVWDIIEGQSYPFLRGVGGQELPEESPYISSIEPSSGAPGIIVTIYGRNFDKITERVTFGSKTAEILAWGDDTIWAKVPEPYSHGEQTVDVTAGGIFSQKTNSVPFTYKMPVLDKVYPSYGKPGDEITFEGQHFGEVQHPVEFGRSLVLPISRNDTEIVAKAPFDLGFGVEEWIILQLMIHVANGVIPGSGYLLDVVYDLEAGGVEFDWSGGDIDVEARVISGVGRSDAKRFTFNVYEVIAMALSSPGEPRIIDAHGNVTGVVDGQTRREIPYSFYANETALLVNPDSSYSYEVVGTGEGTYGLRISHICDGSSQDFEAVSIPIEPGSTHAYTVDWQALSAGGEGVILNIDKNGDGFFEQMAIADNELSYDEFALQTETVVDFDPDTLNLNIKGKFATVYIELPEDIDVSEIDLFSLALNELVHPLPKPIEIGDYDSDGTNDLMVKFNLQELIALLEPGEQIIDLTGRLLDGRRLAGFDFIRVIH